MSWSYSISHILTQCVRRMTQWPSDVARDLAEAIEQAALDEDEEGEQAVKPLKSLYIRDMTHV